MFLKGRGRQRGVCCGRWSRERIPHLLRDASRKRNHQGERAACLGASLPSPGKPFPQDKCFPPCMCRESWSHEWIRGLRHGQLCWFGKVQLCSSWVKGASQCGDQTVSWLGLAVSLRDVYKNLAFYKKPLGSCF